MFKPKYTISPKLVSNIKKITTLIINLNNQKYSNIILASLEKKAREISAHASTSIEGNPLPLTEVRKILKNKPEHIRDSEKEVLNYNQALQDLNLLLKEKSKKIDLKLILKIQKKVTNGLINKFYSGKVRKGPVLVNDPRLRKTIYFPPDHQDVEKLMNNLIEYINSNQKIIDPLILAGIFHKQFVVIHPFMDGNGRTARLITKVILANLGLDTFNLFSFENYYNNNVTKYFNFIGEKGDYYNLQNKIDFTPWLEYFTDGIIDELLRVSKELKEGEITPDNILQKYHQIILANIKKNGYVTDKIYANLVKRSKASRNSDFNKLIILNLIVRLGKGKATIYKLK